MVEILVYLARHDKLFGEQASLTLAGWDEKTSRAIAADPNSPKEVLEYMVSPKNVRPVLVAALLDNPAISESALAEMAAAAPHEAVDAIRKSARTEQSSLIRAALDSNPHLMEIAVEQKDGRHAETVDHVAPAHDSTSSVAAEAEEDTVLSEEITSYLNEHAVEIAASEKPFHPIGGIQELNETILESEEPEVKLAAAAPEGSSGEQEKTPAGKKTSSGSPEQRGSALQKIARLDVKGRIQLAMKGNKEERSILVRDGTKVVALGVLESPKITDAEVEAFANQKNVLESLLRGISMKRRFMKNYNVVRNLVANPRTPLDVSLGLMKNLLIHDLKNISANKDVPDTIRKLALKMYKQKRDSTKN
jgi:hypothetical protein